MGRLESLDAEQKTWLLCGARDHTQSQREVGTAVAAVDSRDAPDRVHEITLSVY